MGTFLIEVVHLLNLDGFHARVEFAGFLSASVWILFLGGETELLDVSVWVFNSVGSAGMTGGVAVNHLLKRKLNVSSSSNAMSH